MVCSSDGDTDFFNIVAGVLQGDTFPPYIFLICENNIQWMSIYLIKENGFTLKTTRSRWYLVETMTDTDYTDDLALLINKLVQAEFLLHS